MVFVGLGACTYEFIGVVERIPLIGTSQEFRQLSIQGSGTSANAMVYLARWGEDARFVGKVGDDSRGREIILGLSAEGVDASHVVMQPEAISQLKWVLSEDVNPGYRSFLTAGTVVPLTVNEVNFEESLKNAQTLLIDGMFPSVGIELTKAAKEKEVLSIFCADELTSEHIPIIESVDHVIVSERLASRFFKQSHLEDLCDEFLSLGAQRVTITIGEEGAVGKGKNVPYCEQPGIDIAFVDSLGASGAYFAATAFAEAKKMSMPETLKFANVTAALSCTGFGPRANIPSLDEIFTLCN